MMVETLAVLAVLPNELAGDELTALALSSMMRMRGNGSAPTMTGRRYNGHSSGKITVWVSRSATRWQ
jgi:hypothetical protein